MNINSCGISLEDIERSIYGLSTPVEKANPILPLPPPSITENSARLKYIDDMSMCQAVNLKDLESINWDIEMPLNYHDRTFHHLPQNKNKLQNDLMGVHKFCEIQKMMINEKKTQTVIFNTAIKRDFTPRITNSIGETYRHVENFELLGVDLSSDRRKGINFDTYLQKHE